MAQRIKVLAAKPGDLSSILQDPLGRRREPPHRYPDFHIDAMHGPHTYTNKVNKYSKIRE